MAHAHEMPAPAAPRAAREHARAIADPSPGAEQHDEWLLDEALDETFPASDPISPATRVPRGRVAG